MILKFFNRGSDGDHRGNFREGSILYSPIFLVEILEENFYPNARRFFKASRHKTVTSIATAVTQQQPTQNLVQS